MENESRATRGPQTGAILMDQGLQAGPDVADLSATGEFEALLETEGNGVDGDFAAQSLAEGGAQAAGAESEGKEGGQAINVVKSSMTIAAGTMTSRILGFVRGALLLAVLGAAGVQDSFSVANNLPNQMYGLLAGSVISAVLLPQIVRAFARPDGGHDYVHRLLTLTGVALFVMTVVMTLGASVVVTITYPGLAPATRLLAVTWAYWFMPQIFFYGMQSVLGQVLNARGHFWEAAWSPVINNVVSIAGLFYFVALYGWAPKGYFDPASLTANQILVIAIPTTLGIVLQAVALIWPLKASGYQYKFTWGFRGYGLGEAFRVAAWTMASAAIYMVSIISVQMLASAAEGYAVANNLVVAGPAARANAFTIYMLPHSVITASVATALFAKVSRYAANGDDKAVRNALESYVHQVSSVAMFFVVSLLVFAVPIMQAYGASRSAAEINAYAGVLRAYAPGLIVMGLFIVEVDILLSYNLAKTAFYGYLAKGVALVGLAGFAWLTFPPTFWVEAGAMAEVASFVIGSLVLFYQVDKLLPGHTSELVVRALLSSLIAAVPTWLVGWTFLTLVGEFAVGGTAHVLLASLLKCAVGGVLCLLVYLTSLWVLGDRQAVNQLLRIGKRFLPKRG
ncbi:hypothetical protein BK816_00695 [Boudabousia tangfeifanii]|uniref:Murein biosynthesis integral membrane protein MurJ n=2 Tax=Boudabousia tangfeifanii TaxID=1912795 RepID=A0A1D9MI76_9ACTO|nr:hypothetical protein BK816_00695 [Boudabousia tangfeifanii]